MFKESNEIHEQEKSNTDQEKTTTPELCFQHDSRRLKDVVAEILNAYPDQGFYFLNEGRLRKRVQFLREQFLPDTDISRIAYAIKANPKKEILKILNNAGINDFDCASPEEIAHVLQIVPNAKILYNNPTRLPKQIRDATKMGVRHFTVQTQKGIEKIINSATPYDSEKSLEIAVRMKTHNNEAEINLSSKFGTISKRVKELVQFLINETNSTPGIAVHTGSQNKSPEMFIEAIKAVGAIVSEINELVIINLGGGFPVNYDERDNFNLSNYFNAINKTVKKILHKVLVNQNGQLIIEPGRSMVADSLDLVIPIVELVEHDITDVNPGIFINDGIFTSFSDSAIHGWRYVFHPFSLQGKSFSDEQTDFTIFGRTCDSGDVIRHKVLLPANIDEGDYLWIKNAGAYLDSQATNFNGFKPHPYVFYNS